jgi:hypothetical protein
MDLHSVAGALLGTFCIIQGLATIVLDLNRTHAAHPRWLGHARFHVVWQTGTVAALAIFETVLLWYPAPFEPERFYLVALLACMPMFGFFAALAARRLYGGALSDPGGIPPLRFGLRGRQVELDMNLVAEVAGIVTVVILVWMYRIASPLRNS